MSYSPRVHIGGEKTVGLGSGVFLFGHGENHPAGIITRLGIELMDNDHLFPPGGGEEKG